MNTYASMTITYAVATLFSALAFFVTTKGGVLSLLGADGYPYGLPLSHFYCEEDNKIY